MRFISVFTFGLLVLATVDARYWRPYKPQQQNRPPFYRPVANNNAGSSDIDCSIPLNQVTLHPHPTSCTLYLQCNHGSTIERPCAPGTEFSPSVRACVHARDSDCTAGQESEEEESIEEVDEEVPEIPDAPPASEDESPEKPETPEGSAEGSDESAPVESEEEKPENPREPEEPVPEESTTQLPKEEPLPENPEDGSEKPDEEQPENPREPEEPIPEEPTTQLPEEEPLPENPENGPEKQDEEDTVNPREPEESVTQESTSQLPEEEPLPEKPEDGTERPDENKPGSGGRPGDEEESQSTTELEPFVTEEPLPETTDSVDEDEPTTEASVDPLARCAREPSRIFLTADPSDCSRYIICASGQALVRMCDDGEYFNADAGKCIEGSC